jgi:hypothetical protein
MRLWPILADRLPLALPRAEHGDKARPDHQGDQQRRRQRGTRTERLVSDEISHTRKMKPLGKQVQH